MRTTLHAFCITLFLLVSLPMLAQEPAKAKTKKEKRRADKDNAMMQTDTTSNPTTMQGGGGGTGAAPYTALYSSQFTIGNAEHARMILTLWKDWDDNMLDRNVALMADTISMDTPDGQTIRGRDSVMMVFKQARSQYTTVKSVVEAYMPLRSTDRNEDFVAIWGLETDTSSDGSTTTKRIQEVWRINRDGKIDYMRQYTAKPPVQ